MLKVAVVGLGRIGQVHLQNLLFYCPDVEVVGVVDPNEEALETTKKFRLEYVGKDLQELINKKKLDAVFICSSTDTHAGFIEIASNAGIHCFCEKPIDMDLVKVEKILKIVEENKTKLMVAFNRRFDEGFRQIRDKVQKGDLKDVYTLKITSRDPSPPKVSYIRRSGGLFMDMMIHDFDMARYVIGSEVERVYTLAGNLVDPIIGESGDVDTAVVVLKFSNGVIGTIENCRQSAYGYDQRVEVHGRGGMLTTDNLHSNNHQFYSQQSISKPRLQTFFLERYAQAYRDEVKSFVSSVLKNEPPKITGHDGLQAMRLALAAKKSFDDKKEVFLHEI